MNVLKNDYSLVIGRCGDTISQNNTYFESRGSESGSCTLKICKCSTNVCQLRLDFETFQISGPSTSTQSVTKVIAGSSNSDGGAAASNAGRCLTDQFSVTATTASNTPPTICGQNTGEHSKLLEKIFKKNLLDNMKYFSVCGCI